MRYTKTTKRTKTSFVMCEKCGNVLHVRTVVSRGQNCVLSFSLVI